MIHLPPHEQHILLCDCELFNVVGGQCESTNSTVVVEAAKRSMSFHAEDRRQNSSRLRGSSRAIVDRFVTNNRAGSLGLGWVPELGSRG
jgi:hypothetical protein